MIDISLIPDYVMDQLCASLYESISIALSDPKLRQEYEAWKKEQGSTKQEAN